MQKRALRFGRQDHLIGVVHEKGREGQKANLGALLWNTGISNRCGPFRANVEVAESLASIGVTTLRFDLSRLGDSDDSGEKIAIQDRSNLDIADALEVLARDYGITRVLLIGLCSSAVDAYYYARSDARIKGIVMVDSFVYPTLAHRVLYFFRRVSSLQRWLRRIKHTFRRDMSESLESVRDYFEPNYPSPEEVREGLNQMLARGIKMLVIYTGGFAAYFSHIKQFTAMLGAQKFGPAIRVLRWPQTDHLFTMLDDRQKFLDTVKSWVESELLLAPHQASEGEPPMSAGQPRTMPASPDITRIMEQQLRLMEQQLEILRTFVASAGPQPEESHWQDNASPRPHFMDSIAIMGEIELHTDRGTIVLPHYEGAFVATDTDGQAALFIENPEHPGEIWKILAA